LKAIVNEHQLHQVFSYIERSHRIFGTKNENGKVSFGELASPWDIPIPTPKVTIPFKKILWPNGRTVPSDENDSITDKINLTQPLLEKERREKIALIGLPNCDAKALTIFLKEFRDTNLLIKREDILVVSTQCHKDDFCFCSTFDDGKIDNFDLHIQKEGRGFAIYAATEKGKKILKECGIKHDGKVAEPKKISLNIKEKIEAKELSAAIDDKNNLADFWQKIAGACFGCGACSAVCPLCFCTRTDFKNQTDGSAITCLKWDSCFSSSFSQISGGYNSRPERSDRLYNWYHHKFVRAYTDKKHFLCTGCGRCIKACPANLNQRQILLSAIGKEEKEEMTLENTVVEAN